MFDRFVRFLARLSCPPLPGSLSLFGSPFSSRKVPISRAPFSSRWQPTLGRVVPFFVIPQCFSSPLKIFLFLIFHPFLPFLFHFISVPLFLLVYTAEQNLINIFSLILSYFLSLFLSMFHLCLLLFYYYLLSFFIAKKKLK